MAISERAECPLWVESGHSQRYAPAMRSTLLITFSLICFGGCSERGAVEKPLPADDVVADGPSRTVQLNSGDLKLPDGCASMSAPIIVTFGPFKNAVEPWFVGSPADNAARATRSPPSQDAPIRTDGLTISQPGGYLTSPDFTIQCRSADLMGFDGSNRLIRCRLSDTEFTRMAGFDVPVGSGQCTGFISREIQRKLTRF